MDYRSNDVKKLLNLDFSYPDVTDTQLQSKIYKKREFHIYKAQQRKKIDNYEELADFRNQICGKKGKIMGLNNQQILLKNYFTPETPYNGLFIFHNVGVGKCVDYDSIIEIVEDDTIFRTSIGSFFDSFNIYRYDSNDFENWINIAHLNILVKSYSRYERIKYLYREKYYGIMHRLTISNSVSSDNIIITISPLHKIYVCDKFTNEYSIGDNVAYRDNVAYNNTDDDSDILYKITNIEYIHFEGYIYDLEVENTHSYYINDILTHNTCAAIAIAENFKTMVQKYNTKIYILVPGPYVKEMWKKQLIQCTGNTYMKMQTDINTYTDVNTKIMMERDALLSVYQYYKIMTFVSFKKKVIGDVIKETKIIGNKMKKVPKKNSEGKIERDIIGEKIDNLNDTLLIIDEAHRITNNSIGEAVSVIKKKSKNLKIILLTATPMKNFASDIIELLNFIRPYNDPIIKDKVFINSGLDLEFANGGYEYLQKMINGYVSFNKGLNPLTFATQNDIGEVPKELLFTKVYKCFMDKFQYETYRLNKEQNNINETNIETLINNYDHSDGFGKQIGDIANFVFPILNNDKKIIGISGKNGIHDVILSLKSNAEIYISEINKQLFNGEFKYDNMIYVDENKNISGTFMKLPYLKVFSTKFATCLENIEKNVEGINGSGPVFVYSNLVILGVELFRNVLLNNGYLEYNENGYNITNDIKCYYCGIQYDNHTSKSHDFNPATFVAITGDAEEGQQITQSDKTSGQQMNRTKIIDSVINKPTNKYGKNVKIILGSIVLAESITLENIKEIHILDVHFTLGRVQQIIGRGIRYCVHYDVMSESNPYPVVNVYKYVISNKDNELTTDEILYKNAELKFIMIKKVERALMESAIDCPLNISANIYKEEFEKYKGCEQTNTCPAMCEFQNCYYKCFDESLNEIFDDDLWYYRNLNNDELDYLTFTPDHAKNEIDQIKSIIKSLYKYKYVYELPTIISKVKEKFRNKNEEMIMDIFIFKALQSLLPVTENDFNNFNDIIYDKYSIPGYLIYRYKYYIFQPFNENEDVSMYYRSTYRNEILMEIPISAFLILKNIHIDIIKSKYNFDISYYSTKKHFTYVGIIDAYFDKKTNRYDDYVFKIKDKSNHKGTICLTSPTDYLIAVLRELDISINIPKKDICNVIREKLLSLEKYNTNNMFYMMIPTNHDIYKFPYNIHDRVKYIKMEMDIIDDTFENNVYTLIANNNTPQDILDKYNFSNYTLIIS